MDAALIIGLIGMACILMAFMLNVFQRLGSHDARFLGLNLLGSILLVIYALMIWSTPFLILNMVWAVVALWGLIHHEPRMKRR